MHAGSVLGVLCNDLESLHAGRWALGDVFSASLCPFPWTFTKIYAPYSATCALPKHHDGITDWNNFGISICSAGELTAM
jgi:hypothetical protein